MAAGDRVWLAKGTGRAGVEGRDKKTGSWREKGEGLGAHRWLGEAGCARPGEIYAVAFVPP